jgi:PHS family inorganic phosphate transporter-like MFS transporter
MAEAAERSSIDDRVSIDVSTQLLEARCGESSTAADSEPAAPAAAAAAADSRAAAGFEQDGGSGGSSNAIPALSNFSIQYNLSAASIALPFMQSHPAYAPPGWVQYVLLGAVFVGAVVGMLVMGYLGDLIGRRRAMVLTLAFQSFGAIGCALFDWGSAEWVYTVFCASRLLLGVGVGGMYPLSASHAAEGAEGQDPSVLVGRAFFWQAPGAMAPYAVSLLLLLAVGDRQCSYFGSQQRCDDAALVHVETECVWHNSSGLCKFAMDEDMFWPSFEFRLITGLGAIPALIVMFSTLREPSSHGNRREQAATDAGAAMLGGAGGERRRGALQVLRENPRHLRTLLGTGGTWFLFDVSYYGTFIFLPKIQATIFGRGESLFELSWQALLVTSFGLVGTAMAVRCLPTRGAKWLNVVGFALLASLFAVMAITHQLAPHNSQLLFAELLLLNTALFFGPPVATYVLPMTAFPPEVRSTFHGLSAGCGKVGAVAGTFLYEPVQQAAGTPAVMWLQCATCFVAVCLAHFCIDNVNPASNEDSGNGGNAEIRSSHSAPGGACAANESLRAQGGQGGDASA